MSDLSLARCLERRLSAHSPRVRRFRFGSRSGGDTVAATVGCHPTEPAATCQNRYPSPSHRSGPARVGPSYSGGWQGLADRAEPGHSRLGAAQDGAKLRLGRIPNKKSRLSWTNFSSRRFSLLPSGCRPAATPILNAAPRVRPSAPWPLRRRTTIRWSVLPSAPGPVCCATTSRRNSATAKPGPRDPGSALFAPPAAMRGPVALSLAGGSACSRRS